MRFIAAAVLALACADAATAEVVVPIRQNGPPENRIGMAILGDGYTQADLLKYSTDVDLLVKAFFEQPPYSTYASYFNVYRVDVISNESGADHPERNIFKDTALGARYNCGGIQRTICVDATAVNAVVSRSLPATSRDIIVVLVNDPEYGGSGGTFTVASTHPSVVELALHEGGHSFGLLGDEYDTQPPTCNNSVEPPDANVARDIDRQRIKWARWIDPSTLLPTTGGAAGLVGAFQGAKYCPAGLFRPTNDSKMRSLGRPFEAVNTEQLVRRVYNFVSPIDAVFPVDPTVTASRTATLNFSAESLRPSTHDLAVKWLLDDVAVGSSKALALNLATVSEGSHRLEVVVSDPTTAVLTDPAGALGARRAWTLIVQPMTAEDLRLALLAVLLRLHGGG